MKNIFFLSVILLMFSLFSLKAQVTTPEDFFGFKPGIMKN